MCTFYIFINTFLEHFCALWITSADEEVVTLVCGCLRSTALAALLILRLHVITVMKHYSSTHYSSSALVLPDFPFHFLFNWSQNSIGFYWQSLITVVWEQKKSNIDFQGSVWSGSNNLTWPEDLQPTPTISYLFSRLIRLHSSPESSGFI